MIELTAADLEHLLAAPRLLVLKHSPRCGKDLLTPVHERCIELQGLPQPREHAGRLTQCVFNSSVSRGHGHSPSS